MLLNFLNIFLASCGIYYCFHQLEMFRLARVIYCDHSARLSCGIRCKSYSGCRADGAGDCRRFHPLLVPPPPDNVE